MSGLASGKYFGLLLLRNYEGLVYSTVDSPEVRDEITNDDTVRCVRITLVCLAKREVIETVVEETPTKAHRSAVIERYVQRTRHARSLFTELKEGYELVFEPLSTEASTIQSPTQSRASRASLN